MIKILFIFIILFLIFFVFYYNKKDKNNNLIIIEDNLTKGINKYPSLLILNNEAKYTNIIKNKNDKILLTYKNNDENIYYSYLNLDNCQIVNDNENDNEPYKLINEKNLNNSRLFSFNYMLFLSSNYENKVKITSIQTFNSFESNLNLINTYKNKDWCFFSYKNKFYVIYSISPFIIYEIEEKTFDIISKVIHQEWIHEELQLGTTPVLIGKKFYMVAILPNNKMIFVVFNAFDFKLYAYSNEYICEDDKCTSNIYIPFGLVYNKLNNFFYISINIENYKIGILKINLNFIKSKLKILN
jgi:hypothetical protein